MARRHHVLGTVLVLLAVAAAVVLADVLVVAAPLVVVLAIRLDALLAFITSLPETLAFDAFGFTYATPIALATVAAVPQFLPVVGPSVLLTFGTIGIVAGPLVLALVAETSDLLANELHDVPVRER
ncbi:MAG: hypothetical protein ABEJ78_07065 [Haloferacaceae archaeon]